MSSSAITPIPLSVKKRITADVSSFDDLMDVCLDLLDGRDLMNEKIEILMKKLDISSRDTSKLITTISPVVWLCAKASVSGYRDMNILLEQAVTQAGLSSSKEEGEVDFAALFAKVY